MDEVAILARKLEALFPDEEERNTAQAILERYGPEDHEQEEWRVRLAILKLSGADLAEIEQMTAWAKKDFRDILLWAEYPRQGKKWSLPDGPQKREIVEADRAEYEQWLDE